MINIIKICLSMITLNIYSVKMLCVDNQNFKSFKLLNKTDFDNNSDRKNHFMKYIKDYEKSILIFNFLKNKIDHNLVESVYKFSHFMHKMDILEISMIQNTSFEHFPIITSLNISGNVDHCNNVLKLLDDNDVVSKIYVNVENDEKCKNKILNMISNLIIHVNSNSKDLQVNICKEKKINILVLKGSYDNILYNGNSVVRKGDDLVEYFVLNKYIIDSSGFLYNNSHEADLISSLNHFKIVSFYTKCYSQKIIEDYSKIIKDYYSYLSSNANAPEHIKSWVKNSMSLFYSYEFNSKIVGNTESSFISDKINSLYLR